MVKKLTAHGNSAALIIDRPIMELLHISMDTPLELRTDGFNLIVSPVRDASREKKFKSSLNRVFDRHASTMKKLAGG
jgi:antitoxin MazE